MARILIVSHSPYASTGYGRVARGLAGSLTAAGHQIVCMGMGRPPTTESFPYPVIPWNNFSSKAIGEGIKSNRIEALLTIGDPWMFETVPSLSERKQVLWLAYFPIDGYPLPTNWKRWVLSVDIPVVFSKFAQGIVHSATGLNPQLIHHGVNTAVFTPEGRTEAKELAKVAGQFVVGTVARNQQRKNIPALVRAFAVFAQGKDDVQLYLHTQKQGDFDLLELIHNAKLEGKARTTGKVEADRGLPDQVLATVYRAMDVFVLPTMAEGFGLPIMESQACGTPALVTDFSACTELLADPIQRLKVKATLTMTGNFEQAIVDEEDIAQKLERLYRDREFLASLGKRCHEFAQSFHWDGAYRQFNEIFSSTGFAELLGRARQGAAGSTAVVENSSDSARQEIDNGEYDKVAKLHEEAVSKFQSGAFAEAAQLYRAIVELRPLNRDFQNQLASSLHASGDLQGAIRHYRRSLELSPSQAQSWVSLGDALLEVKDFHSARNACERAMALIPDLKAARKLWEGIVLAEQTS